MMGDPVEIHVLDKKVRLLQPEDGFRTSLDSVMLAAACPAVAGERILDLGCGVGAVGFCILRRVPDCEICGVDFEPDYIALARQNISLNEAENCIEFVTGDVRDFRVAPRFDHVVCNPPFLESGRHTPSPRRDLARARGHEEENLSLADWVKAAHENLRPGGTLTMIHRADALDRILQALGRRFGAVEIMPLWPRAGEPAKRVVIRARKGRKTPVTLHAGIILHQAGGSYTPEADNILRGAAPLL